MVDVADKAVTFRRALARGSAILSRSAFEAVRDRTNPKGDVLALAEAAGIMAAKRTAELIPLCHPLPLNQVRVRFELEEKTCEVRVWCEASAEAKTGVEMEALCGVNGALLTIYDLSKAVDPVITLSEVRLETKEGGKNGLWRHPNSSNPDRKPNASSELSGLRVGAVTVSDRCFAGTRPDHSGPKIVRFAQERGAETGDIRLVPDRAESIRAAVLALCDEGCDLVVLTGGTGLSPRDVTPETVQELCDRWVPGLGERLRSSGAAGMSGTPMSWLSRSGGGLRGKTLIIALPGSPKAVEEGLLALEPVLSHAIEIARGGHHA